MIKNITLQSYVNLKPQTCFHVSDDDKFYSGMIAKLFNVLVVVVILRFYLGSLRSLIVES